MRPYTVVAFYPDNDQPYVAHVDASDPAEAAAKAQAQAVADNGDDVAIAIVEVFEGHHLGVLGKDQITYWGD